MPCRGLISFNYLNLRISSYATTSTEDSVYILGGWTSDSDTGLKCPTIAQFKDGEWNKVADLRQSRHAHGAISYGSLTMVVGGSSADGIK